MNRILTKLLLILFIFNNLLLIAQKEPIEIRDKDIKIPIGKQSSKGKGKAFDDIVSGMDEIPGLFTMYWDEDKDKVYLKIKQNQLDKVYFWGKNECPVSFAAHAAETAGVREWIEIIALTKYSPHGTTC